MKNFPFTVRFDNRSSTDRPLSVYSNIAIPPNVGAGTLYRPSSIAAHAVDSILLPMSVRVADQLLGRASTRMTSGRQSPEALAARMVSVYNRGDGDLPQELPVKGY